MTNPDRMAGFEPPPGFAPPYTLPSFPCCYGIHEKEFLKKLHERNNMNDRDKIIAEIAESIPNTAIKGGMKYLKDARYGAIIFESESGIRGEIFLSEKQAEDFISQVQSGKTGIMGVEKMREDFGLADTTQLVVSDWDFSPND